MEKKAFQDYYAPDLAQCYGCGRLNKHGNQLKSYWDGDKTVAYFKPKPYHTAVEGFVYGGLIASLIDCHATGTAAAAKYKSENKPLTQDDPNLRFVTASLKVDYLKPTPINREIKLIGSTKEIKGRKVIVEVELFSGDELTCRGYVVAIQIPSNMKKE